MTGSLLVTITTPIAAFIAMACWLGMVFWAEGHPGWKAHHATQESQLPGESATLAGDLGGGDLAPPPRERKAA